MQMNAQEFTAFCVAHDEFANGLKEIQGLSAAEWWEKTERGDWMEWLLDKTGYKWDPTAWAEYVRVTAPALNEFEHVLSTARAEFNRMISSVWAEFNRVIDTAAADEYERTRDAALAKLERATATARAEFERVKAPARPKFVHETALALRRILGNPFVNQEETHAANPV